MKTTNLKHIGQSLAVLALAVLGSSAFAASTWSVDGCTVSALQGAGCGVSGDTVRAYAYSVSNSDPLTSQFTSATLLRHGLSYGLGVKSDSENSTDVPDHTMDNNVRTELIAFKFDQSVALDKVTFGWTYGDADFSLFAWNGPISGLSSPNSTGSNVINGKLVGNLEAVSGWKWVGNYDGTGGTTSGSGASASQNLDRTTTVNASTVSSSWWLISAYNAGYGHTNLGATADYMKIMTISSKDSSRVPEPASIALLGLGLIGMVASRRRSQKAV